MADDLDKYKIKQLSIFSENRPGRLMDFSKAMGEEGINILAFSIAEGAGYGVIRAFVSDPEKALRRLQEHGFVVRYTDVIAIYMADKPGGLYELTKVLKDSGINIEYAYAYRNEPGAILVIRVEDIDKAIRTIKASGAKLLDASSFK